MAVTARGSLRLDSVQTPSGRYSGTESRLVQFKRLDWAPYLALHTVRHLGQLPSLPIPSRLRSGTPCPVRRTRVPALVARIGSPPDACFSEASAQTLHVLGVDRLYCGALGTLDRLACSGCCTVQVAIIVSTLARISRCRHFFACCCVRL